MVAEALTRPREYSRGRSLCEGCGKYVVPVRPSRAWWLAVAGVWLFALFCAPWCAIFPLSVVMIPLLMFFLAPLIGATSRKVSEPPRCPGCNKTM